MKERPILFSGPMVRAILDGRKTVTRRIVKPQPEPWAEAVEIAPYKGYGAPGYMIQRTLDDNRQRGLGRNAFSVGLRLWVRETFQLCEWFHDHWEPAKLRPQEAQGIHKFYAADGMLPDQDQLRWRPSIFMPRWASRITLEITGVRVDRLQEISEDDAKAEGVAPRINSVDCGEPTKSYRAGFVYVWRDINGPDSWASNPWVWVLEFKRVEVGR